MADCLGALLGMTVKLGEHVLVPVKRQFNYIFYYDNNIARLRDQVRTLDNTRSALLLSVDAAKRNVEVIGPDVEDWLSRADEMKAKVNEIYQCVSQIQKGCLNGWFPDLKSSYFLSRKAEKIIKVVIELQNTGKFERISYPAPPINMRSTLIGPVNEFNSRKSVERRILDALEDNNVNIIGICGMGGVGKTTMVNYISEEIKNERLFDVVVMVVVTQQPNLRMLQGEIASELGLELKEGSLRTRADRLYARIMKVERIVIIFDDIWAFLNLKELGIPLKSDHLGCKILLTSRLKHVCAAMEAQKVITMEVLTEEEAWILFKEKAGDIGNFSDVAKRVANECKGLPIALVTVALSLKDKSRPAWEDALVQLERSIPANVTGLLQDVYQPLELSYSRLESEEAKSLFLFCCLFKEDFSIKLEDLARYGMGLGMFAGTKNLAEASNRVHFLVETLKDRFLLLEGCDKVHVKMHDVVRDVAMSIASHTFLISHDGNSRQWPLERFDENVSRISVFLNSAIEIPMRLRYPKLEFLLCQANDQRLNLPEIFFDGINTLRVVEINDMDILSLVPSSIQALVSVQVMMLQSCRLENVSIIGELVNLKILSFRRCDIEALPIEMGALTKLRVLDVRMCRNLQIIAPGVLSSLAQLEELHMTNSFQAWEVEEEGIERSNAALTELESLSNLTTLKIQIPNQNVIFRNIRLSSEPTSYYLCIGLKSHRLDNYFGKAMDLTLPTLDPLGDWIDVMLQSSECLRLEGEGLRIAVTELVLKGFQQVKELYMKNCCSVEYLANTTGEFLSTTAIFPALESLELIDLSGLEEICHGRLPERSFSRLRKLKFVRLQLLKRLWESPARSASFANLKTIFIFQCHDLQHLFSLSIARGLVQLEKLTIIECEVIEEVFTAESGDHGTMTNKIVLPKLSKLVLERLPCLTDFCKGFESFDFPILEILQIVNLPKLKGFYFTKRRSTSEPL